MIYPVIIRINITGRISQSSSLLLMLIDVEFPLFNNSIAIEFCLILRDLYTELPLLSIFKLAFSLHKQVAFYTGHKPERKISDEHKF